MFSQSSLSASSTAESTDLTVEDDKQFIDNIDVKTFFVATDNPKGVKCSKDKVGEFAELHVQRAAKTMEPTTFFRNFGSTVVDLTTMALKIFGIALSNEAAEINWKHYKDNSSKARSSLRPDTVHKLIKVQQSAALRSQQFHEYKYEAMKWTKEDELCKLSDELVASRDKILTRFLNYKEDWELSTIQTKNVANEIRLN